ncbi:MAG: hypothetical protein HQL55_17210, partial [Magnetococcales bacterium]|nr:hypothetical protein [Magnetococcales bacterium]
PFFDMERQACEENGVRVEVCEQLLIDDILDHQHIRIFKPDAFFSTKRMATPPRAVDCMVIVKTEDNEAILWFIENKDIKEMEKFKHAEIVEKFEETCQWAEGALQEFLGQVHLKEVRAWFVTTLYNQVSEEVWNKRLKATSLSAFQAQKPIRFANHFVFIQPLRSPQEICY